MKGVTRCVALFVLAVMAQSAVSAMSAEFQLMRPAVAKMRQDKLTIEPADGGPARTFTIELASTEAEKSLGLMYRSTLRDDEGMLFPYGQERLITMWMRNTYISLDMIFIHSDGTIARIEERTEPLSDRVISSAKPVSAVLEISGGGAQRLGIKPGDKVRYKLFKSVHSR